MTSPDRLLKFYHTCTPISTAFAFPARYHLPMRTVYLDELFIMNLVIDYFLLLATARLCALPFRRRRYLVSAAVGGLWSALSLLPGLGFLRLPAMHPVLAGCMTLIAFGAERRLLRCTLAFLLVSALFGGAAYAAGLYRGGWARAGALVRVDLRILALSFALLWTAVSLVMPRGGGNPSARTAALEIRRSGTTVALIALRDTGNGLYDPVTGCAALVAEGRALAALFPGQESILTGDPVTCAMRIPGIRFIPYAGVDGKRRLLPAFRPESVTVDGRTRDDLLVAIAPELGGAGRYDAII